MFTYFPSDSFLFAASEAPVCFEGLHQQIGTVACLMHLDQTVISISRVWSADTKVFVSFTVNVLEILVVIQADPICKMKATFDENLDLQRWISMKLCRDCLRDRSLYRLSLASCSLFQ